MSRTVNNIIDTPSNAMITINHTHQEVHEGNSFTLSLVTPITAGASFYCQVTAPDTPKRIHFVMDCAASINGVTVSLYEAPTTSNGTPATAYNRDRNSSATATAIVVHTPTISNNGTGPLFTTHIDATRQGGSSERGISEFILKQNTKYLIQITADSGSNPIFSGKMDWYEV